MFSLKCDCISSHQQVERLLLLLAGFSLGQENMVVCKYMKTTIRMRSSKGFSFFQSLVQGSQPPLAQTQRQTGVGKLDGEGKQVKVSCMPRLQTTQGSCRQARSKWDTLYDWSDMYIWHSPVDQKLEVKTKIRDTVKLLLLINQILDSWG